MMDAAAALAIQLNAWLPLFLTVLARLSFIILLMPGIGEQVVPVPVRVLLLVGLSAMLASAGIVDLPASDNSPDSLLTLLLTETVIGFTLGVTLRLTVWILSIAGSVIAQSIGLSQFLGVVMESEAQTIVSNLLSLAGIAVLLSVNFHVEVVARIADLYSEIPPGTLAAISGPITVQSIFAAFNFALLLAWPFVAVNLLYNICLGFINKALPQLMVAFVGAPFMVAAGTALLAVTAIIMLTTWLDRAREIVSWL